MEATDSSMLSINMRIFKTVLLLASLGAGVRCMPVEDESKTESPTSSAPSTTLAVPTDAAPLPTRLDADYYDQRQNGSENYRIHVDGVVLVFAPVEALLLAGGVGGSTDSSLSLADHGGSILGGSSSQADKFDFGTQNKTERPTSKTVHR